MKFRTVVTSLSLLIAATLPLSSFSQTAAPQAKQNSLASGLVSDGGISAELTSVVKTGNRVTVKVRFMETDPDAKKISVLYSRLDKAAYENDFYLLAGDKKYLLLKDSAGKPLAPEKLVLSNKGKLRGIWYGTFPAPPEGESLMLFLPNIEPLGPFSMTGE
ncbi:hypothetical protein [Advenella mimigardefordensis]|uniref:Uncharacterized protein n=1 Tax=Advenella mimigardefordensis (strain DSM 17166 / LMG 22922 / DPN7) TaxID=1247726 RepID=W0PEK9_ADVMD|nr:hypothetical protein [Advenella mimigardefordensis]AHG63952.1 hypothetical protein MIM_c18720 [Advenella mimigardefordensis DPN7]